MKSVVDYLTTYRQEWDIAVQRMLSDSSYSSAPAGLRASIDYSLFASGKCVRGALVLHSAKLARLQKSKAEALAAAVELIHCYSLIHDDLPCMDDDDFRRGQLSNHKKFSESTAVLAGDALHALAFEILSLSKVSHKSIVFLAKAIGPAGMVGGQFQDMEQSASNKFSKLRSIHRAKTGKLLTASVALPFAETEDKDISAIVRWAAKLGMLFQITDDILDQTVATEILGKTAGKDSEQQKITFPAFLGLSKSIELAAHIANRLCEQARTLFEEDDFYSKLPLYLTERKK